MGLIERIKAALGLDTSRRQGGRSTSSDESTAQDVGVTVERQPDTTTEDAVKGTDNEADETTSDASEETATAADDELTTTSAAESESTADEPDSAAEASQTAPEPDGTATEDVQSIKGIGPAYAERLADADVETVGDLAAADAGTLSEQTGIAQSRVTTWIDRAGQ
ncbi:helix-hairpin-helix domain-containing protein [Halorhabdus sp. CUG00001]|uniref:helix-hairpin-helix domain-containing protein n=1 Tax=Halorhabdus sp. CUG00001 TaxID=2600297 RepID=UPI00131C5242|nr:helix-hairpin-helix domain-containing protein [Halorhabdus sp. CUG00001]